MADWYVDFTLPSNGMGTTYSGAWNVFTVTEGASVSVGDTVWFRRNDPGNGLKLITIKTGNIQYVGWPKSGDTLYSSRPVAPRTLWDGDAADYVYQRRSTLGAVHTLESGNKFHRFYMFNYYTSYSTQLVIDIISESDVKLYHCYLARSRPSAAGTGGGIIYVDSSSGVYLYKTVLYNSVDVDYPRVKWITSKGSNITFDYCDFFVRSYAYAGSPGYMDAYNETSYIYNSVVTFNYCYIKYDIKWTRNADSKYIGCVFYVDCSDVYLNNTECRHNNSTNQNNNIIIFEPVYMFKLYTSNLYVDGGKYTSASDLTGFVYADSSNQTNNISCENFEIIVDSGVTNNVVFNLYDFDTMYCNTVSGSVSKYSPMDESNFFIGIHLDNYGLNDINVTLSGISDYVGDVIDCSRNYSSEFNYINLDIFKKFCVYIQSPYICIDNSDIGGIVPYSSDYGSTYNIVGGNYLFVIDIKKSNIYNNPCLNLMSTYCDSYVNCLIYNCSGDGSSAIVEDSRPGSEKLGKIKMVRNKGFSSEGSFYNNDYLEYSSVFNNSEIKMYKYQDKGIIETSEVNRTGGAGYSVKMIPTASGLVYSLPCYETVWYKVPASGNYNVEAYMLYTSSGTLTSSSLYFETDVFDSSGESYTVTSNSLVSDSSTWSLSGTKVKLSAGVSTAEAQYCPIRFVVGGYYSDLKVYVDPKVGIVSA